jgi:hypothetical protein
MYMNGAFLSNLFSCKVEHKIAIRYLNLLGYYKDDTLYLVARSVHCMLYANETLIIIIKNEIVIFKRRQI